MNIYRPRFNLYLLPAVLCLSAAGCGGTHLGSLFHHEKKPFAVMRVHVESESSAAGPNETIAVLRSQPVAVNISSEPILTELDLTAARLLESPGGFAVEHNGAGAALAFATTVFRTCEVQAIAQDGK